MPQGLCKKKFTPCSSYTLYYIHKASKIVSTNPDYLLSISTNPDYLLSRAVSSDFSSDDVVLRSPLSTCFVLSETLCSTNVGRKRSKPEYLLPLLPWLSVLTDAGGWSNWQDSAVSSDVPWGFVLPGSPLPSSLFSGAFVCSTKVERQK